jgi:DNA mismatch endonuclease, patch repair protein
MADCFTKAKRSWVMGQIRAKDTEPERALRRILHQSGFRFRLHGNDLPGKPDIVLKKYRTLIYVNGCFWHGHHCQRGRRPGSNKSYWVGKIEGNIRRDARIARKCRQMGWKRIVVWQCQLRQPEKVQQRVVKLLEAQA